MNIAFCITATAHTLQPVVVSGGPHLGFEVTGKKSLWILKKIKIQQKNKKMPYSTGDSLVVPYQSTDPAQRCLTSQFGWDAVLSPWYDRMTRAVAETRIPVQKNNFHKKKKTRNPELFILSFSRSRHC